MLKFLGNQKAKSLRKKYGREIIYYDTNDENV